MSNEAKPFILIVDDDVDSAFLIRRLLSKSGLTHESLHLVDGERAIEYLNGCKDHVGVGGRPTLMILDIKMPKVSGLEVLQWMRKNPARGVPVVVMTTSDDPGDRQRAAQLTADAFLAKFPAPEEFRVIFERVSKTKD